MTIDEQVMQEVAAQSAAPMVVYPLLTAERAAELLAVKASTLANWRSAGRGPAWIMVGGAVRYRVEDLVAYVAEARQPVLPAGYPPQAGGGGRTGGGGVGTPTRP